MQAMYLLLFEAISLNTLSMSFLSLLGINTHCFSKLSQALLSRRAMVQPGDAPAFA